MPDDEAAKQDLNVLRANAACPERYEILGLIGQGGMGMVLRAFDSELSRDVAIKILSFDGAREPEAQERFLREAKTLAVLDHPNIVSIYSSGLNSQGNPYNIMEFLEGVPLSDELRNGPLDQVRFFSAFKQILAGLEYAHRNKVVHRDLKPSNIMHCKDADGNDLYKVIDFGIARADADSPGAGKTITRTDAVLGSPAYISPEQCRSARADHLSDIYSLGCIMYECITGHQLFEGETALEIMYKHMTVSPVKLTSGKISPKSVALAQLVDQCLEKDPALRPKSVTEIIEKLEQIQSGNEGALDIFSRKVSKPKIARSSILKTTVLLSVLLLLGAGVGLFILHRRDSPGAREFLATRKQDNLAAEIAKAKAKVDKWNKGNGFASGAEIEKQHYFNDLLDLGRVQLKSSQMSDLRDAESTYRSALKLCDQIHSTTKGQKVACLTLIAKALLKQGDETKAKEYFDQALKAVSDDDALMSLSFDVFLEYDMFLLSKRDFAAIDKDLANLRQSLEPDAHADIPEQVASVDRFAQRLDVKGDDRLSMVAGILTRLIKLKPQSQEEAVDMVKLSNRIGDILLSYRFPSKPAQAYRFSLKLLQSVKGEAELKAQTQASYERTLAPP